jgi:hypothetical protein
MCTGTYYRVAMTGRNWLTRSGRWGNAACTILGREGIMWGRVLAVSGGLIILAVTIALWYSDHQKNIGIISNWQKDYNSLLTDRGNINIQNVQLIRQNRQLVYDKQQLSDGLEALNQKIDASSVQIDQLIRANELAEVTTSDLEKERKINKNLLDESGRLRRELETLRQTNPCGQRDQP